jgi:hypothetical protein
MIILPVAFLFSIAQPADRLLGSTVVFNQTTFIVSAL